MSGPAGQPILGLQGVKVRVQRGPTIIEGVDLELHPGEIVCLVGESGSGKTTTALTVFGNSSSGLVMSEGRICIDDQVIEGEAAFRRVRGRKVAYVPQNPATSLNPSMRIVDAITETVRHKEESEVDRVAAAGRMLGRVGLPATVEFGLRFPHQLSGGQQQRVCIAIALAAEPEVVVLDEPTTGLDVVTQDRILTELLRLREEEHVAMLYITHDLAVAAKVADRVVVMYGGFVVEEGPAEAVLGRPWHPYTRGLMAAIPDHLAARDLEVMTGGPVDIADRPSGCPFAPRCPQKVDSCDEALPTLEKLSDVHLVRCTEWDRTPAIDWSERSATAEAHDDSADSVLLDVGSLNAEHRSRHGSVVAAAGISFQLKEGACLALVGESGSGKTTIARVIAGLHTDWSGQLRLRGEQLAPKARNRTRDQRRRIQIVFQSPSDALNPKHSVGQALMWPARTLRGMSKAAAATEVQSMLDAVQLPARYAERYPRELSGGQCQRVAIARALAADPDVIICDEITSALDVSVQARILELLAELRRDRRVSLLFITHDLGVVSAVADEVLVLDKGVICETGTTNSILTSPQTPYTRQLLAAAPSLVEAINSWKADTKQADDGHEMLPASSPGAATAQTTGPSL
ncbi:MAG: ABC transporter ATP-binding protein [Acidimicrobiales bacterium]